MTPRIFARSALAQALIASSAQGRAETADALSKALRVAGIEDVEISAALVSNVYTVDEFVFYVVEGVL